MKQIRFTKEGYEKIKQEYADLLAQRPAVVEDLKKAREMGDLKENGYYKASRSKLNFIDGRLFRCKLAMKQALIVDSSVGNGISIGSVVTLSDGKKEIIYTIVGDLEADPSQGKISLLSPLGQAIEGKKIDDIVHFSTPAATIAYKIISIT
jgi:transcription elongation factor GreA